VSGSQELSQVKKPVDESETAEQVDNKYWFEISKSSIKL
jgi:hypothetical protein